MGKAVLKGVMFDEKSFRQAPFSGPGEHRSHAWIFSAPLLPELSARLPEGGYYIVVGNSGGPERLVIEFALYMPGGKKLLAACIPWKEFNARFAAAVTELRAAGAPAPGEAEMTAIMYRQYTALLQTHIGAWFAETRLILEEIADGLMNALQDYECALIACRDHGRLDLDPLDALRPADRIH